jgi:hypothetical protein
MRTRQCIVPLAGLFLLAALAGAAGGQEEGAGDGDAEIAALGVPTVAAVLGEGLEGGGGGGDHGGGSRGGSRGGGGAARRGGWEPISGVGPSRTARHPKPVEQRLPFNSTNGWLYDVLSNICQALSGGRRRRGQRRRQQGRRRRRR